MNTIRIWFIGSRSDLIWSIFRWLRSSIVTWFSNHLESPLIIKVIPVLIQPNKKNESASEFIRNFKTIQSHFSKNSLCRAWSRGSILIWSLFWMIWVWPEIKVCCLFSFYTYRDKALTINFRNGMPLFTRLFLDIVTSFKLGV